MAFFNDETNELHLKILYTGSTSSGKTTNLQSLYRLTSSQVSNKIFDLGNAQIKSFFFDFLPLSLGISGSRSLRLHLYTLPAHDLWESVLYNLANGVDGVVVVIDSRLSSLSENVKQLARLKRILLATHRSFENTPVVFQFNHQDAADALPIHALKQEFFREDAGYFEGTAVRDSGTFETLQDIAERSLQRIEDEQTHPIVAQEHLHS